MTVDASGQVFMRGIVVSEEAGREIVEAARSVPGVTHVETDFQIPPRRADGESPPPLPEPIASPACSASPATPRRRHRPLTSPRDASSQRQADRPPWMPRTSLAAS